ncbi:LuxR C-terminal-related transcriptional regulator [Desulfatibacillum aliphaticivorans]|uniref:LuxR C-terminal-related transcriptional regulator n=1 Tax=Desulfatibacillum aliphaticivorans TaxID=218208 RepID=UPI001470AC9C|nr:LuxR C-terminal-related transcriptional regulator [Desulfatibacillum aliphaticivorans]
MNEINDYGDLHNVVEYTLKRYFHIDWVAVYSAINDTLASAATNEALPFNWGELYREIEAIDKFSHYVLTVPIGYPAVYEEVSHLFDEEMEYCLEFADKHCQTRQFMVAPLYYENGNLVSMGMYRTDKNKPFLKEERELIQALSPLLVNAANSIRMYQEYGLKRVALDRLTQSENLHFAVLDGKLGLVELPLSTLSFLRDVYADPFIERIPSPIEYWIKKTIAPAGRLLPNTGPWNLAQSLPGGDLHSYAYVVQDDRKRPMLLIKFELHGATEDFSILQSAGFTPRETETLSYLPLGYSNQQIAMAMGITHEGVKKHLRNVARKFDVERKTEVLFQAMQLKKQLEYMRLESSPGGG